MKNVIDMTQYLKAEEKSPVYAVLQIPVVTPREPLSVKHRAPMLSVLADFVDLALSLLLGAGLLIFLLLLMISL